MTARSDDRGLEQIFCSDPEFTQIPLYATARRHNLSILFKLGIGNADYLVSEQDNTQTYRDVHHVGVGFGVSLALEEGTFIRELLESIRSGIGAFSAERRPRFRIARHTIRRVRRPELHGTSPHAPDMC